MAFIIEHGDELLAIVAGIISVASAIAALTPSPKDDGIIAKIRKVVDLLALNVGNAKKS